MASDQLHLTITDRDNGKVFESDIKLLTATNEKGQFDVLPAHAHFISLVDNEIKITHMDNREEKMMIKKGVMKVFDNAIQIYVGVNK
jgi:F0F1-type ATP synthase epsilon subunit